MGGVLPSALTAVDYPVTFVETGLPSATVWTVTLGGAFQQTSSGTVTFEEPNGTFGFVVGPIPGWHTSSLVGTLRVDGAAVEDRLPWIQVEYPVTFLETGLPAGTEWWVAILNGTPVVAPSGSLSAEYPNGSYTYTLGTMDQGYAAPSGSFVVRGIGVQLGARFSPITLSVKFEENGLPPGTSWSVTLNGSTRSGTGALSFPGVRIGTYRFSVPSVGGYDASPSQGSVLVFGPGTIQWIVFNPVGPSGGNGPGFDSSGPDAIQEYVSIAGVVAVIITAGALMFLLGPTQAKQPTGAHRHRLREDGPPPRSDR